MEYIVTVRLPEPDASEIILQHAVDLPDPDDGDDHYAIGKQALRQAIWDLRTAPAVTDREWLTDDEVIRWFQARGNYQAGHVAARLRDARANGSCSYGGVIISARGDGRFDLLPGS